MLDGTRKNLAITGTALALLFSVTGASVIYNDHNVDMSIGNETSAVYTTESVEESISSPESHIQAAQATETVSDNDIVYVSASGRYHAKSDCSGMKSYTKMPLDEATQEDFRPCRKCYPTATKDSTEDVADADNDTGEATECVTGIVVYVSTSGKYHTKADCSGMKRYTEMDISEAAESGYDACKKCASHIADSDTST